MQRNRFLRLRVYAVLDEKCNFPSWLILPIFSVILSSIPLQIRFSLWLGVMRDFPIDEDKTLLSTTTYCPYSNYALCNSSIYLRTEKCFRAFRFQTSKRFGYQKWQTISWWVPGRLNAPTTNEVAVISIVVNHGKRDIILQHCDNNLHFVSETQRSFRWKWLQLGNTSIPPYIPYCFAQKGF